MFRRNHLDSEKPIVLDVKPSVSMNASEVSQKYLAWFASKEGVQLNMSTTYGEEKVSGAHRLTADNAKFSDWEVPSGWFCTSMPKISSRTHR